MPCNTRVTFRADKTPCVAHDSSSPPKNAFQQASEQIPLRCCSLCQTGASGNSRCIFISGCCLPILSHRPYHNSDNALTVSCFLILLYLIDTTLRTLFNNKKRKRKDPTLSLSLAGLIVFVGIRFQIMNNIS